MTAQQNADGMVARGQLVVAMLVFGLVAFAAMVLFVLARPPVPADAARQAGAFAWLVPIVWGTCAMAALMLPRAVLAAAVRKCPTGLPREVVREFVSQSYMMATLLRGALLEGPGLLGAVATMITGDNLFLVATGMSVVLLLITMPSRIKLDAMLEAASGRKSY